MHVEFSSLLLQQTGFHPHIFVLGQLLLVENFMLLQPFNNIALLFDGEIISCMGALL